MTNAFYTATGNPLSNSAGSSALVREEFTLIQNAFDAVPQIVTTNPFSTIIDQQADVTLTLPAVDGTLATLAGAEALTNKTIVSPALTGIPVAPTAAPLTDNTQVATTAYANLAVGVETGRAEAAEAAETARAEAAEASITAAVAATYAPLISPPLTGTPTAPTAAPGTNNTQAATTAFVTAAIGAAGVIPGGSITGLTLSNDVGSPNTVLDIAAGRAADSTNAIVIVAAAVTKSIAAPWAAGSGTGGMGTGLTATASTWYHAFEIINAASADVYFDTSPTAANRPAGTTAFRRIGSFFLDGSTHILPFTQNVDRFDLATPIAAFSGQPGVTTAVTVALATPAGIPMEAILTGSFGPSGAGDALYVSALYQVDFAPNGSTAFTATGSFAVSWSARVFTNTSASIRMRTTSGTDQVIMFVIGWIDTRGR